MESFKCPYCGKSHPDTTIFCVQKQRSLVKYPTALLVVLLLLAFVAVLVTAFTQPTGQDDNKNFFATVFIYKPWLFYSFLGLLLLVWEGSFLRNRPVQRWAIWSVTVVALLIVGLFTAKPDLITTLQNSQALRDFFNSPWLYIIANLLFVLFWLYQTVRRRLRRDKTRPLPTLFSDDGEEENAAIAETEYTSGDLLAGAIIFLFSAFVFPFLYLVIARYALQAIPQSPNHSLPLSWLFNHFDKMTSLRIGGNAQQPDLEQGFSLALLDLAIAALLFAISTISLLIVTYNQGLEEIHAVTPQITGKLPSIVPQNSGLISTTETPPASESDISSPTFTRVGGADADATTDQDIELAVGETVARTAIAGLTRAILSLRVVMGSAALSVRNLLWPFAIFVGAAFTALLSSVVYTYLHSVDKFPFATWSTFTGAHGVGPTFVNWLVSWLEIGVYGLVALALVTFAIALLTRSGPVLPDAVNFLRRFGLLAVMTYWIFAAALGALNFAYITQEFVKTSDPNGFFFIQNRWPLAFDFTAIISFVVFAVLAGPLLLAEVRRQRPTKQAAS
ncbi:MAG TPA: hypothetical protein VFU32_00680 [Ktedonobacterales bacterium]|nr:hypothetical protein [Ktedonobacterales bacterium]